MPSPWPILTRWNLLRKRGRPQSRTSGNPPEGRRGLTAETPDFDDFQTEAARELGLDSVKRIIGRWGFQDRAPPSEIRIEARSPRKGFLALFDQPGFRTDQLPVIPPNASSFVLASFDPEGAYQKVVEMYAPHDPVMVAGVPLEQKIQSLIGLRLREDLLRDVGPTWAIVDLPAKANNQSCTPSSSRRSMTRTLSRRSRASWRIASTTRSTPISRPRGRPPRRARRSVTSVSSRSRPPTAAIASTFRASSSTSTMIYRFPSTWTGRKPCRSIS